MEVNPRMGGSVGLAVRCGVDLPWLSYLWAAGETVPTINGYRVRNRTRWLAGDLWNLRKSFGSPGAPDVPGRTRAMLRFAADFVVRPSAFEPLDLHDPVPVLFELRRNLFGPIGSKVARVIRQTGSSTRLTGLDG